MNHPGSRSSGGERSRPLSTGPTAPFRFLKSYTCLFISIKIHAFNFFPCKLCLLDVHTHKGVFVVLVLLSKWVATENNPACFFSCFVGSGPKHNVNLRYLRYFTLMFECYTFFDRTTWVCFLSLSFFTSAFYLQKRKEAIELEDVCFHLSVFLLGLENEGRRLGEPRLIIYKKSDARWNNKPGL